MRVPAEDIKQVQTVIDGRLYTAHRGFFDMPERDAKAHMASANFGGAWNAMHGATGRRTLGYRCPACNHGSYFKRCKCGATCEKEA